MKQKYYLALSTEEWRLLIHCLNNFRKGHYISELQNGGVDYGQVHI